MMTGLYKSTPQKDFETAEKLAALCPDTMRIYPTAVIKNTALAYLYHQKKYFPPNTEESVELCARLLDFFESKNIKVIRLGLHDSHTLQEDFVAGVYHPAFRELCESKLFADKIENYVNTHHFSKHIEILVNHRDTSKLIGQKKSNILYFENLGYKIKITQTSKIDPLYAIIKDCEKGQCSDAFKIFGNTGI